MSVKHVVEVHVLVIAVIKYHVLMRVGEQHVILLVEIVMLDAITCVNTVVKLGVPAVVIVFVGIFLLMEMVGVVGRKK